MSDSFLPAAGLTSVYVRDDFVSYFDKHVVQLKTLAFQKIKAFAFKNKANMLAEGVDIDVITRSMSFLAADAEDLVQLKHNLGYNCCDVCNTWHPNIDVVLDEEKEEYNCLECYDGTSYNFHICTFCFAFGHGDTPIDCDKCGKKMCMHLYQEANAERAFAMAKGVLKNGI